MTLRVGLIGYPVTQSLSPVLHQTAFDTLGIDAHYELWPTPPEQVAERVASLRAPGTLGANVTVPHKTRAFDLVDEVSDRARSAGAVNTIINRDGRLAGDNTDIPGFLVPLRKRNVSFSDASAVILGAGGAARGVAVALLSVGCPDIVVANRTVARAIALAEAVGGPVEAVPLDASLASRLTRTTLLINATSLGWGDDDLPLDAVLIDALPADAWVYDLTYRETPLLNAAQARGLATLDGLEMLVEQGAEALRLWTGVEPPVDAMLEAARAARSRSA